MKPSQILALTGISLLTMSNSCEKQGDAAPTSDLVTGRVLKTEITVDRHGQNPRPRWIVDIAPLSFPGWAGKSYQHVKTFSLPDTLTYKPGVALTFHYQLIPFEQQTPWQTEPERNNLGYSLVSGQPLPELVLSGVQPLPTTPKKN